MNQVLVIFSVHRAGSAATPSALLHLLERAKPEVIFLEFPRTDSAKFFEPDSSSLEASAVSRYRDRHATALVPVDLPGPGDDMPGQFQYLFGKVEAASREFANLEQLYYGYVDEYGFGYLNSPEATNLQRAIQAELEATVQHLDDGRLSDAYSVWIGAHERREAAMMDAIEGFAKTSPFSRGIFLVGSAHSPGVAEKVRDRNARDSTVRWVLPWGSQVETDGGGSSDN